MGESLRLSARSQPSPGSPTIERTGSRNPRKNASRSPSSQWRIVVASMRDNGGAEVMAQRYRNRLAESMLVNIVIATTDEGHRHRGVVGEFENKSAARQALAKHEPTLPSDAWTLRLQSSTSASGAEEGSADVSPSAGEGGSRL